MRWLLVMCVGLWACDDEPGSSKDATVTPDVTVTETSVQPTTEPDTTELDTLEPLEDTVATETSEPADTTEPEDVPVDTTEPEDTNEPETVADTIEETSEPEVDAGPTLPLPGFGAITGDCGVLDDELLDYESPSFFVNHIDFGTNGWTESELALLTDGAQEMYGNGTAGGSSIESEMFAFEVLARCELASLVKTETEVVYDPPGSKKTDILVELDDLKIGVSVLRAFHFPPSEPYTEQDALTKLTDKLVGINESSVNVVESDKWVKQILHIIAWDSPHVETLRTVWEDLDDDLKRDTIIIVTVTDGDDAVIY